jgi:flavodoxin
MTHDANRTSAVSGLIVYSTRTGNTEKVARGVYDALTAERNSSDGNSGLVQLAPATDAPDPSKYDWIILAFWVNRGTADDDTLAYLKRIERKPVGFIATLGAYPNSEHAATVSERVANLVSERNRLLGSFLCQGRVDPRLTEKFKSFPPDHPHAMTPERAKRHRDAASHPDDQDIANAVQACREMLSAVEVA